jgi:prepilin-type N-terminal cleavage/methylation domain-containing protein
LKIENLMKTRKSRIEKRGFTLVEMMVTITIMLLLTTAFLGNRNQYSDRLLLKSQAYNILLAIRQAQVEAMSVKGHTEGTTNFDVAYGIYFDPDLGLLTFTDENNDGKFQSGSETNAPIAITGGVTIQKVCDSGDPEKCILATGNFRNLAITFKRPLPMANIIVLNNGGYPQNVEDPMNIYLISSNMATTAIKISPSGGISIQ